MTVFSFSVMDVYGDQVQDQEGPVENEVSCPGHMVQDTAAGAGYAVPVMQHDQGNVAGEGNK